jgi:transcriptional regulator with GAF, ATPase, and Fis domain
MNITSEIIKTGITSFKIVGFSKPMLEINKLIERIAPSDSTVLIFGETGTGKELIARAIHMNSQRKNGPFVTVNSSAFSENLFESELFGHVKGAFTGAVTDKKGRFELADGGSLFLDEIGDLPPSFQVKLLRILQEREFERVGDTKTFKIDVRILAATNKKLKQEVQEGRFREDLFYRLNVIKIDIPPLRDRKEDIPILFDHFKAKYAYENTKTITGISNRAMAALRAYSYPGNVRQLENIIQRAVVLSRGNKIMLADFSEEVLHELIPYDSAKINSCVKKDKLLKELKRITVTKRCGVSAPWHNTMKCITIEKICEFLQSMDRQWFSRKEFAKFLRNNSKYDRSKYKTAGNYLKILKENRICVHNGEKANKSRYRLAGRFIKKAKSH